MEINKNPMKRIHIVLLLILSLLLAGCKGRSFQDIRVTSLRLVSVEPQGLSGVSAVLEVGLHNPAAGFELKDLQGLAKFKGQEMLQLNGDPVSVAPRSDELYELSLQGRLADGFSILRLLRLLGGGASLEDVTFDLRGRATLRSGLGRDFEFLDVPLSSLTGGIETGKKDESFIE